jgi:endonuclease-3
MPKSVRPSPKRKQQAAEVVRGLKAMYPESACALHHRNPFELLVATILSAQCTDARVNMVTPALFARYPDAAKLARAKLADVEKLIHSTGFFRAKAKNLVAMATALVADHGGDVPEDLDALTALPGVGRKTAHVVLGVAFHHPSGVVVDTHVKRLAFRLGLTKSADPKAIEHELAALVPRDEWINLSHRLIEHGREICIARRPNCEECGLNETCPKLGVTQALRKKSRSG